MILKCFLGLIAPLRSWYTKTTEYNCRVTILQFGVFTQCLEPLVLGQKIKEGLLIDNHKPYCRQVLLAASSCTHTPTHFKLVF